MPSHDAETTAARADLCRLLAACYYQPGPEFAEEGVSDSIVAAAAQVDAALAVRARRLREAFAASEAGDLLVDYTRLFLGPAGIVAKPYGSVWLDETGALMGESAVAVQALYHEGGFELDETFREAPDHVAAELEFLYLLLFREAEGLSGGDSEAVSGASDLRRRFLGDHLGRWIEPFTRSIAEGAHTTYYRELASLTSEFVLAEAGRARPLPDGNGRTRRSS
jgi:TorA maturation chaperone TorD